MIDLYLSVKDALKIFQIRIEWSTPPTRLFTVPVPFLSRRFVAVRFELPGRTS